MQDERGHDGLSGRGPRVPDLEVARALLWLGIAVAGLYAASAPAQPPVLAPRRDAAGACALAAEPGAERCACGELPGALRHVLGLPLPLARASAADLESLPDIGPRRARAIVEERARRPFASTAELARVPGIGPASAQSLGARLFVGPDPACGADRSDLTRSAAPRPD